MHSNLADLGALLQRHVTRLENTVRWSRADGVIASRDNRATQHYAAADYDDLPRLMHRATTTGATRALIRLWCPETRATGSGARRRDPARAEV